MLARLLRVDPNYGGKEIPAARAFRKRVVVVAGLKAQFQSAFSHEQRRGEEKRQNRQSCAGTKFIDATQMLFR